MTKDEILHRVLCVAAFLSGLAAAAGGVAYFACGYESNWIVLSCACVWLYEGVQWLDRHVEKRLGIPSFDERIEALRKAQEREEAGVA